MGTWGTGNFDNDGALDYAGGVMDGLVARIEAVFADEAAVDLDEDGETVLVPSVQMISMLCEHCRCAPPQAEIVARWKEQYIAVFDEQIEGIQPVEGFESERRAVIVQTFDALQEQAQKFWAGSQ